MTQFVHLHLHSHYSLLDGANKIDRLVTRAEELGMPALALTDHGNLFGAVQFHDTAAKHGVKPIIGCEAYVAKEGRHSRSGRRDQSNHLVLLAADDTGYANLSRLASLAYLEGFYYRPRIDKELLQSHSKGLIALSACLKGGVPAALEQDRFAEARQEAGELAEIFGRGNFFLELQDHYLEKQRKVNPELIRLARELDLPLVATNDCHYLERQDASAHDVLLCIGTNATVKEPDRLKYATHEFYFKTAEEMAALFRDMPEALANTIEIANRCDFRIGPTQHLFPDFAVPSGYTLDSYFEEVVNRGFDSRLPYLDRLEKEGRLRCPLSSYRARLDREIEMIKQMKFPGYFLVVWDFIRYAREADIPVGPGRGSAAGSLVSYAMRITDVDPLQYDLLFERFLNPERITPPDIDIDFCTLRRGEVIDYVTRKYGRENVSQIITFGTMAARGAIRDVGRGLDVPLKEVDQIARLVPQQAGANITIDKALESVKELRELVEGNETYQNLVDIARRLEGLARHPSTHAAGVVIAPRPLIELLPLFKSNKDEITTQFEMKDLDRLGLLKMDFLGLATLTVINQTLQQIKQQRGDAPDLSRLELNDELTFRLFGEGRTSGIFQFESAGMRDILRRLQPDRFEDLIALNALYRPGPIKGGMIDDFINRRHGRIRIDYEVPALEDILKETYGVIVYQEQVMQIASALAGFTLGEADSVRRAMAKKKPAEMVPLRKKFLAGARERGYEPGKAARIFDLMEQFAEYGFNKSHSTAYALLAYQTAYLKAHFPVEFMSAMLTNEMSNTAKMVKYLGECKGMGISVSPPDINSSGLYFQAAVDRIQFGLVAIRNVGEGAIKSILATRRQVGGFRSFFHFCETVDLRAVNKRVLESLIKAGAFDSLGYRRKSLVESLDKALEQGQKAHRDRLTGQQGLFTGLLAQASQEFHTSDVADAGEWSDRQKWAYEKESVGYYLTGHPLQEYQLELQRFSQVPVEGIGEELAGHEVSVGGVVTELQKRTNRKGEAMASFVLEDLTGTVEVMVWPSSFEKYQDLLVTDAPILVKGRCEFSGKGELQILCSVIRRFDSVWDEEVQRARLLIPLARLNPDRIARLGQVLEQHRGSCSVEFELIGEANRVHVVPAQTILVNPRPEFIRDVEELFGEKCVSLYT